MPTRFPKIIVANKVVPSLVRIALGVLFGSTCMIRSALILVFSGQDNRPS